MHKSQPNLPLPSGTMLGICCAVVLTHLAVLQAVPATLGLANVPLARPLVLRSITLAATRPAAPAPTQTAAAPQPAPKPRPVTVQPVSPPPAAEVSGPAVPTEIVESTSTATVSITPVLTETTTVAAPEAAASAAPLAVAPVTLPGSARVKYDVVARAKGLQYQADAELLWRHDGKQYEARLEVSALLLGARTQTSQGTLGAAGLAPVRFSNKSRSEQAAHFDYNNARVRFSANTPDAPLQPGAQDRLSVVLQLAALLAGEPARYPTGSRITLQTVGPRDADSWVFVVEPAELLNLPGGELTTIKLTRQPRREFDIKVELWLAPAQNYLPVRTLLTQSNGDFVDQLWHSTSAP
ncbi:MAG: DUF3108 domain-containing protein [Burkholderiales bacterium]